ncbi:MAG: DUF5678 domain-containing protein [Nitrososphaerales archaeon]
MGKAALYRVTKQYKGVWVAIFVKKIVAYGRNLEEVKS